MTTRTWARLSMIGIALAVAIGASVAVATTHNPPRVDLFAPVITDSCVTVSGGGAPGAGESIIHFEFDWDDGQKTIGFFPADHIYGAAGTFEITVTALQSDLQTTATSTVVTVPVPPPPGGQPPLLQVFIASTIGTAITVNGFTIPGAGCTLIERISWDWGDGQHEDAFLFPGPHTYAREGVYVARATAHQTDGEKTSVCFVVRTEGAADGRGNSLNNVLEFASLGCS